ncbi:tripartite tricarboxylate transporter substrate binding protein [Variovorax sp. J22G21]|uniref:tripartite tricarboxylate transporter substrate binding protein n=1 Tax=Variovorax fucosicus TaxID=3053517 RepID=UPI002574C13F|nr:tripartite tricarboxylate transporter substrate binding protein [Variovorax sp. J22G21]MDM0061540.1 tripartite tricarboxylate transporter substrate binding protein [Variovorax sp. J22G21]
MVCRSLQAKMQEVLGQAVIIDNRGGAGGNIGTALGAKAAPDGYTVTFVNQGTMALNPSLYPSPGYKVENFAPVTQLTSIDLVIVAHPSVPANNLKEFLELARKEPGKYTYGTAGNGSANHLAGEMLKSMAKVDITHVPYKGGGPAIIAALGGEVSTVVAFPLAALPHIRGGKLKALAVTGKTRSKALPEVPTVAESGVTGYEFASWMGLMVPKGTPDPIVQTLQRAAAAALKDKEVAARLSSGMTEAVGGSPKEFGDLIALEGQRWSRMIKQFGMKID